ncbi:hypothetical protein Stube_03700 [Streptomyces tubercidicus]|uniref:Uncharacterized protein n=1 Tax=Streptomyces tubercidicus TaxID=47759 RepID=A0A640UIS8_9ACTN|nr:hypothetical protein Stube_03700 [Streptomyces tubercidicus]
MDAQLEKEQPQVGVGAKGVMVPSVPPLDDAPYLLLATCCLRYRSAQADGLPSPKGDLAAVSEIKPWLAGYVMNSQRRRAWGNVWGGRLIWIVGEAHRAPSRGGGSHHMGDPREGSP